MPGKELTERMIAANKLSVKTGDMSLNYSDSPSGITKLVDDIIVEFNNKLWAVLTTRDKLLNEGIIGINAEIGVLRGGRKVIHAIPAEMR